MEMTLPYPQFTMGGSSEQPTSGSWMKSCAPMLSLAVVMGFAPGEQLQRQQRIRSVGATEKSMQHPDADLSPKAGDFLTTIKEGWQFNMSELADILGVARPTVYSWMNGKTSRNEEMIHRLQALAAAAAVWNEQTNSEEKGFLLDYMGPLANEPSIRQRLKSPDTTADELRELIPARVEQSRKALEQTRAMLGEALPLPATSPPDSARRMNAAWAKNTKALHATRNRNS